MPKNKYTSQYIDYLHNRLSAIIKGGRNDLRMLRNTIAAARKPKGVCLLLKIDETNALREINRGESAMYYVPLSNDFEMDE